MTLANLWTFLQDLPIAGAIGESWWFPLLESVHVLTATFLFGAILMLDLRLLGLSSRNHPISRISNEIVPWAIGAAAVSMVTGVGLFITRASHYAENPAFRVKMALLLLAGLNMVFFHLRTSRTIESWDTDTVAPVSARLAGAVSLLLWTGVLLAGRWTGHLS